MKLAFLVVFFFMNILTSKPQNPQIVFKVTTFTEVPKDMEGCGENLFLNKKDEKTGKFIFYTDYVRGLICVNNKMILITHSDKPDDKDGRVFSNKDYTLVVKYG